jgi:class 3 adenylate cyclase/CHASE2 domain-containing sensor protein
MTRIERRVFVNSVVIGLTMTAVVLTLDIAGLLSVPENVLYDLRARFFQFHTPPPTSDLVHVDIDDKSLDTIGYWPWPRATLAEMIDEMSLAGAKAIALDILFKEPQKPVYEVSDPEPATPSSTAEPSPTAVGPGTFSSTVRYVTNETDNDALFIKSVRRAGNVLIPASIELSEAVPDPSYRAVVEQLTTETELARRLRVEGVLTDQLARRLPDRYLVARREAVYRRIRLEIATSPRISLDAMRTKLMRRSDASINSPLARVIDDQWNVVRSARSLARAGMPLPTDGGLKLAPANVTVAPMTALTNVALATPFVDFHTDRDGVLRRLQMFVEYDGRAFMQMGLALAVEYLGVNPRDVTVTADRVVIPMPGGRPPIVIPVRSFYTPELKRPVPTTMDLPWFGGQAWETMYDWPDHAESRQHVSAKIVWDVSETHRKLVRTLATADQALADLYRVLGLGALLPMSPDDVDARFAPMDRALAEGKDIIDYTLSLDPKERGEDGTKLILAIDDLKTIRAQATALRQQLAEQRAELVTRLRGKAVLVGWAATGAKDTTRTPLHAEAPGVVAHGVIFNAIVTQRFWKTTPEWINWAIIVMLGGLTALIAGRISPITAFFIVSLMGIGYVLVNGLVLFGQHTTIVDLASPQIAMAGVWSACAMIRIRMEAIERARITRQFRTQVDPMLVDYLVERPGEANLAGESREMTVCFSDLAGMTSLSERLGERIVPIINDYMNVMVPIIRRGKPSKGYVNKFLGDGIMFFFGAPIHNPDHAADAVETALLMQEALVEFNKTLRARDLPAVKMRIGVSTGLMVVGNAGSKDAADYTVLGDAVNFASRLESANKMTGTSILISERTAQMIGSRFLIRPVGALQVVGKSRGVMTFEVCGFSDRATPAQQQICERTRLVVDNFSKSAFEDALKIARELDETYGPSTLTVIYRQLCEAYLKNPPPGGFDGTIVFTEK